MKSKNVSVGFSERKYHSLKKGLLPIIIVVSYIIPFAALLAVDITKRFGFLVPIALFILAFEILGAPILIWLKFIRHFGFPSLRDCMEMLKLDALRVSRVHPGKPENSMRDGVIFSLLFSFLFMLLWKVTGYTSFLFPAVFLFSISIKGPIRRARPPAILLLGASSYESTRLQLDLISIFDPSLVASGLHHLENATVNISGVFSDFNSVRTAEYDKWQEMITTILRLSKIVIVDIHQITDAVRYEIDQVIKFIGSKPVYFVGECMDPIPADRCIAKSELLNELELKYKPGGVSRPKSLNPTVYEDKKNGYFRIHPPLGWIPRIHPDPRTKVTFTHPKNPNVTLTLIVKESQTTDFSSLVINNQNNMQKAERALGVTCKSKVTEIAGRKTIETQIRSKDSMIQLIRIFIADGLHFNISYTAPNKAIYDSFLDEINHSVGTLEVLGGTRVTSGDISEKRSLQEIANKIRMAELAADHYDIDEANRIIAELARKYPNNKDVQKTAKDLEKISRESTH